MVGVLIVTIVVIFVLSLIRSFQADPAVRSGVQVFSCDPVVGLFCLLFLVFGPSFGLFIIFDPGSVQPFAERIWVGGFVAAFFALPSLWLCLDAFFTRIEVSSDAVIAVSLWRGRRKIPFTDLRTVYYSPSLKSYRLVTGNQGKVRLEYYLRGLGKLLTLLDGRIEAGRQH